MTARRVVASETVRRILELACHAPSVHNTQPWLWRVSGNQIDLFADTSRLLEVSDARGRNLTISCGAALHHLRVAAGAVGLPARVTEMPDPSNVRHLARVELAPSRRTPSSSEELRALEQRRTDRRRFTSWPVPAERLEQLTHPAPGSGVHVTAVTDVTERDRLELLVRRAMDVQQADPRYLAEQERWLDHSDVDGIPATVVEQTVQPGGRPSRFAGQMNPHLDDLLQTTDGVLAVSTDHDDSTAWLRAGEALSAVWLRATTAGMSVVPLSQAVEIDETRAAIQHDLLGGFVHPQILLRIGWQQIGRSDLPPTPRRPLDDVLLT